MKPLRHELLDTSQKKRCKHVAKSGNIFGLWRTNATVRRSCHCNDVHVQMFNQHFKIRMTKKGFHFLSPFGVMLCKKAPKTLWKATTGINTFSLKRQSFHLAAFARAFRTSYDVPQSKFQFETSLSTCNELIGVKTGVLSYFYRHSHPNISFSVRKSNEWRTSHDGYLKLERQSKLCKVCTFDLYWEFIVSVTQQNLRTRVLDKKYIWYSIFFANCWLRNCSELSRDSPPMKTSRLKMVVYEWSRVWCMYQSSKVTSSCVCVNWNPKPKQTTQLLCSKCCWRKN